MSRAMGEDPLRELAESLIELLRRVLVQVEDLREEVRAQLRVLERADDPAFIDHVREAEKAISAGDLPATDPADLVARRLRELTSR